MYHVKVFQHSNGMVSSATNDVMRSQLVCNGIYVIYGNIILKYYLTHVITQCLKYFITVFIPRMLRKHFLKDFGHDTIPLSKETIEINMHSLKTNREEKRIKDNIYLFLLVLHFIIIRCLYNQFPISPCVYKITFMNCVTRKFSLVFYVLVCDIFFVFLCK